MDHRQYPNPVPCFCAPGGGRFGSQGGQAPCVKEQEMSVLQCRTLCPAGMDLCNGTTLLPLGSAMLCGPSTSFTFYMWVFPSYCSLRAPASCILLTGCCSLLSVTPPAQTAAQSDLRLTKFTSRSSLAWGCWSRERLQHCVLCAFYRCLVCPESRGVPQPFLHHLDCHISSVILTACTAPENEPADPCGAPWTADKECGNLYYSMTNQIRHESRCSRGCKVGK